MYNVSWSLGKIFHLLTMRTEKEYLQAIQVTIQVTITKQLQVFTLTWRHSTSTCLTIGKDVRDSDSQIRVNSNLLSPVKPIFSIFGMFCSWLFFILSSLCCFNLILQFVKNNQTNVLVLLYDKCRDTMLLITVGKKKRDTSAWVISSLNYGNNSRIDLKKAWVSDHIILDALARSSGWRNGPVIRRSRFKLFAQEEQIWDLFNVHPGFLKHFSTLSG